MGREPVMDRLQVVAAAAIDRTDERLGGIRMQGCSRRRVPHCFRTQHKQGVQLKLFSQLSQPAVTHELGPQAGATAHGEIGVVMVDEFRGSEAQHGITEEFQPFKVFASTSRHMGQCLLHQAEQLGIVELLQADVLKQLHQLVCSCAVQRLTGLGVKAGHKPGSVHATTEVGLQRVGGYLSGTAVTDGLERRT